MGSRSAPAKSLRRRLPELITIADIEAAAARIEGAVRVTPVMHVEPALLGTPDPVALKLELFQHAGSFKARGAYNLVAQLAPERSIVAASGGNFGLAIAWAASVTGHRAAIFVPEVSSSAKQDALRAFDCELHVVPGFYADALAAAQAHRTATNAGWAHAYDQPEIVAGAGTCARELEGQLDGLDTVLVAVGGGGFIGGAATWFADSPVKVVGVETSTTATMHTALAVGEPVDVVVSGRAADSLGARRVGDLGFAAAQRWVDQVVLVQDDDVREAQRRMWQQLHVLAEPGGAAAAAALISGAYVPAPGERVAVMVCGSNTDLVAALS